MRYVSVPCVILAVLCLPAAAEDKAPARARVTWFRGDLAGAKAEAERAGRLVFVFWVKDGDPLSSKMQSGALADEDLAKSLNSACVNVRIDAGANRDLAASLNVTGVPTVLFLDPEGNELGRLAGNQTAAAVSKALRAARSKQKAGAGTPGGGTPGGTPGGAPGSGNDGPDVPDVDDPGEPTLPGDLLFERVLPGIDIAEFAPSGTIVRFLARMGGNFDGSAGAPPQGVKVVYVTDSEETKIPDWAERAVVPAEYYQRVMRWLRKNAVRADSEFTFVFDVNRRQIAKCVGLRHRLKDVYAFCRAVSEGFLSLDRPKPGAAVVAAGSENPFTNAVGGLNVWPNGKVEEGVMTLTRGQVFLIEVSGSIVLSDAPGHTLATDGAYVTGSTGRFAVPGTQANQRISILRLDSGAFVAEEDSMTGIYHALMPGHGIKLKAQITRRAAEGTRAESALRVEAFALQDVDLSEPEIFPEKPAKAKLVQMLDVWANSEKAVTSEKLPAGRRYIVEVTGTIELAPAVSSLKVHADAAFVLDVGDRRSKFWKKEPARASSLFVDGAAFAPREDRNASSAYSWRINGADRALSFTVHDPHDDDLTNNAGGFQVTIWDAGEGEW